MAKEKFVRSKPHVNVGTIGHIDHGKTTLTAALVKVQSKKGLAKEIKYADIAKGGIVRDETKTVTIAVSHVEYESADAPLRARRLPGPRRLHQEHDSRARRRWTARSSSCRRSTVPCRQTREHVLLARQVGLQTSSSRLNKCDALEDARCSTSVEMEVPRAAQQVQVRRERRRSSRSLAFRRQRDAKWEAHRRLISALDSEIPDPYPRHGKTFLMRMRTCSRSWAAAGRHGRIERGI
jgi:elongation factor Tu